MSEYGDFAAMYGGIDYEGATVLDIGADHGSTARFLLDRGAVRIIASERNPELASRLWEYAAVEPRVKVLPALTADNAASFLRDHDPKIVKVDCEGCERFLLDVEPYLLRRPKAWIIETHTVELFDAFHALLTRLGYAVERIDNWKPKPGTAKVVRLLQAIAGKPAKPEAVGLITGMGRSGSMWTARALRDCCGLDARHESVPFSHVGKIRHVEVNSMFVWEVGSWSAYPPIPTVHLVRDGRDVVRSACERNPGTPFDRWVWEWTSKNDHMLAHVSAKRRFRLENLIGDNPKTMQQLAAIFGAKLCVVTWRQVKSEPANAGPGLYPRWQQWPERLTAEFWRIAGDVMERCGYAVREEP